MDYLRIKAVLSEHQMTFDELDWNWFEYSGELWLPEDLVREFEAMNRKLMAMLKKSAHSAPRPVLRNVLEPRQPAQTTNACKCDVLYPDYQRCSN